jgi:hypothetical protein
MVVGSAAKAFSAGLAQKLLHLMALDCEHSFLGGPSPPLRARRI